MMKIHQIVKKPKFQALALFGLATVGVLDKDRVSRLLSVHLSVMLSVWYRHHHHHWNEYDIDIISLYANHHQYLTSTK